MSRPGDGTTVTIERRQEPELTTVAELPAVEEMAEMPIETAKRISA
jgi:hypothetical protein